MCSLRPIPSFVLIFWCYCAIGPITKIFHGRRRAHQINAVVILSGLSAACCSASESVSDISRFGVGPRLRLSCLATRPVFFYIFRHFLGSSRCSLSNASWAALPPSRRCRGAGCRGRARGRRTRGRRGSSACEDRVVADAAWRALLDVSEGPRSAARAQRRVARKLRQHGDGARLVLRGHEPRGRRRRRVPSRSRPARRRRSPRPASSPARPKACQWLMSRSRAREERGDLVLVCCRGGAAGGPRSRRRRGVPRSRPTR